MGTTKQTRKFKIDKELEETPDPELIPKKRFKILVNGANFLLMVFDTYKQADEAAQEFIKGSNSNYDIVESKW